MSAIEWTDVTWNPVRGCSRVSEGCRNCYAERMAARFSGPGEPFFDFAKRTPYGGRWTGRVEVLPGKLDEPLRWRKPQRIFVNSMSDLFHEALPDEAINQVFAVMALAPRHTFQVLTKRPERMRAWFAREAIAGRIDDSVLALLGEPGCGGLAPDGHLCFQQEDGVKGWPLPNVWLGVSVEDQATADERIPLLLQTPAGVRFVSYEPALGPLDLRMGGMSLPDYAPLNPLPKLDWVICGGESGPGARPFDVAWARSVVRQCREAGVACFVKQLGARPWDPAIMLDRGSRENLIVFGILHPKGGDPAEWPEDLRVREFPR